MSTSKKEKGSKRGRETEDEETEEDEPETEEEHQAVVEARPLKITLRTRKPEKTVKKIKIQKRPVNKRPRVESLEEIIGSDDEENCIISKELAFYSNSITAARGESNDVAWESGRITPRVLAAATLLVAPKFNDRISPKKLNWARETVAQEIM